VVEPANEVTGGKMARSIKEIIEREVVESEKKRREERW
jgi:hypothetical protein